MVRSSSAKRAARRGAVAVWVVVSLAVLLGVVAITMDGGRMMDERHQAQAAADAAALAAAGDLYENYTANKGADPLGTAAARARVLAAANGYADDGVRPVVTVNIPPASGPFAGKTDYAEVLIESRIDAGFSRAFHHDTLTVRGRAVARGRPRLIGIVVLDSNDNDALLQSGNGSIDVAGSVYVNSTSGVALNQSGSGVFKADSFEVVGGYVRGGTITGSVNTSADPAPDPLRTLPPPDKNSLPVRSNAKYDISSDGVFTLQPGVYRGGITVSSSGATVTLQPGVYYLDGGGFQISGDATVTGNGVMLYNTGGGNAEQVKVSGNGVLSLTAPTSGTYQGISVFQDRAVTNELQLSGNGTTHIGGVVYAPAAQVLVSGNGVVTGNSLGGGYVVNTFKVSGNGSIRVNPGSNRPRVPDVRLAD